MATGILQSAQPGIDSDAAFFASYRWCLNPMLRLRELLQHLGEELESYRDGGSEGWEGEERRINLYLFTCAIACTLDDYLAARPWHLSSLADRAGLARQLVKPAEAVLNAPHAWRSRAVLQRASGWREQWSVCVDAACELLLDAACDRYFPIARQLLIAAFDALGEAALQYRMRIPEAFRCQDLTHHDVAAMVNGCLPCLPDKARSIMVVGPRTAGAYFAPLAAVHLRSLGYAEVEWITVRPKNGLSRAESRRISSAVRRGAQVLIIDDHPNSGNTLRLLLTALRELGAAARNVVVALPGHPAIAGSTFKDEECAGVNICLLPPEERYKAQLLASDWPQQVLDAEHHDICAESADTAAANQELASHYGGGFQVRLKRIIELPTRGMHRSRKVMAKSVGWGWLGYHAWLAGSALDGFVPAALRLRQGILFSEFITGEPLSSGREDSDLAETLAAYVAQRAAALALSEDPAFAGAGYRWCAWDELAATLSRVYGPYLGLLQKKAIRRELARYVAPNPALVDGRIRPSDWLRSEGQLYKTDYEHHNFGGGEPDIVDPAWDLAGAIFEFHLSPDAEQKLLRAYVGHTEDTGVEERLPLYKILYAKSESRAAQYWLARRPTDSRREEWNRRLVAAQSFAAFHLARYLGRHMLPAASWESKLFFLDLDGVLDWDLLGFPHTTQRGVEALNLLGSAGYSVVLNTARSLEHVREYCHAYRLPGGIGELGSVFWDAVRGWEVPLIDADAARQLRALRDEMQKLPGVFLDPENRYSIRAYRFEEGRTRPVSQSDAEAAMTRAGCSSLTIVQSPADTHIVQQGVSKAPALAWVKSYLGRPSDPVAAIGDSRQDVDMLRAAEFAYAPANASREIRELVSRGNCRQMKHRLQAGLLEAAEELCCTARVDSVSAASLLDELISVPDRAGVSRVLSALSRRGL